MVFDWQASADAKHERSSPYMQGAQIRPSATPQMDFYETTNFCSIEDTITRKRRG
jgi:hypothetical protein